MPARMLFGAALLTAFFLPAGPGWGATILSTAAQDAVSAEISKLASPEERALASAWSDAKKVAEFICRPLATSELQKWDKDADRVFLGTDDPATLELADNRELTGSGEVRTGSDWTSFTFTCELDPQSGRATSFRTNLPPRS